MLDIFKLVLKLPHWSWSFITLAPKQEMLSNIFVKNSTQTRDVK